MPTYQEYNYTDALEDADSTAIDDIYYDSRNQILYIVFAGQRLTVYPNFPASTHAMFVAADSLGSFYNRYISGKYQSSESGIEHFMFIHYDDVDEWDDGVEERYHADAMAEFEKEAAPANIKMDGKTGTMEITCGFDLLKPAAPSLYSVRWSSDALPMGPFEPEFQATDEADALAQFNKQIASLLGTNFQVKILAVTHHFG